MELCQKCPMRDERYQPTDEAMRRKIQDLTLVVENTRDFIVWLFEETEHLDHTTYSEVWAEFEEWDKKQSEEKPSPVKP